MNSPEMAMWRSSFAGLVSWMHSSGRLVLACARGCGGADGEDAEVSGLSQLRGLLAGVGVWEGVAGVVDVYGDLARESMKG